MSEKYLPVSFSENCIVFTSRSLIWGLIFELVGRRLDYTEETNAPNLRGLTPNLCLMTLSSSMSVQEPRLMEACLDRDIQKPGSREGMWQATRWPPRAVLEGNACLPVTFQWP